MLSPMSGRIRIIAGTWRGRRLPVPERPGLRPTGDRARETLFNWLGGRVRGARCLDAFAGTGALGLECASRGAADVVLVERDRSLAAGLEAIRAEWPDTGALHVRHGDGLAWLRGCGQPFDLIFLDPPFDTDLAGRALEIIRQRGLLHDSGLVYLETPARDAMDAPGFATVRDKKLGEVAMRLLALSPADGAAV